MKNVISIHGILTRGAWQKQLNPPLENAGYKHFQIDYGMRGVFQLFVPWFRNKIIKRFLNDIGHIPLDEPPSIIAHSFGSYLVAKALEMFPSVKFDRVILCGSIIRRDYPWSARVNSKQINYVLNEYGGKDVWPRLADWVIGDAGASGSEGFLDEANGNVVQQHYPHLGHSDFFWEPHVKSAWIPFLSGNVPNKYDIIREPKVMKIRPVIASIVLSFIILLLSNVFTGAPSATKVHAEVSSFFYNS